MRGLRSSSIQGDVYRKQIEILRILSEHEKPVGSFLIRKELAKRGFFLSERAIRYHLRLLEERGLVEGHRKAGRTITESGLEELSRALAYERVGSILTKYLTLAYNVTYNPDRDQGEVVTNVIMIDKRYLDDAVKIIVDLWEAGFLPSPYVKILDEAEEYRDVAVPRGKVVILTVCNLTIDGVLMHSGIPLILKYGGLVQFLKWKPLRFVDLISYEHSTVHPLEVFVYKRTTSILRILKSGSGMITANMREIPAAAREDVLKILRKLKAKGWGGVIAFGMPNEPILGVPVSMDRCGLSMIGGMTPAAAMMEAGIHVETFAPHCLTRIRDMEIVTKMV
ncbi:NrpR transcriptional repressor [Candidatus Bathyarchaeota archaeon]|nr:MAG: NrpR transcriptional repressor [Candidatus Bathyarchaeota archaeon]